MQWLETLAAAGFAADMNSTADAVADARRAAAETVIAPLDHLGLLRAEGPEAATFLHNLLTNDVSGMGETDLRRAGFCTPKGRLLADLLLWRDGESIMLQLAADLAPAMQKKLSMYILRSKAKLGDASDAYARIGIAGPQAVALLQAHSLPCPAALQVAGFDGGTVLGLDTGRFEIAITMEKASALWQALSTGASPVGTAAWLGLDIAAGIPLITAATSEAFVPQMVNYELIGGVGFKKGCYPGQEIVARTQYLGKIKRRMYRAHLAATSPCKPGTQVYAAETGEQACGAVVLCAPAADGGQDLLLVAQSTAVASGIHIGEPAGPRAELLPLPYAVD